MGQRVMALTTVWSTFRCWIPGGYPIQQRGVTKFPGLYFLGMNLLHSRKSGILFGVGDDAAHVAADISSTSRPPASL